MARHNPEREIIDRMRERCRRSHEYSVTAVLLAFGLVLTLLTFLMLQMNPRLGRETTVVALNAPALADGPVLLTLEARDEQIAATIHGHSFKWPEDTTSLQPLGPLTKYLKELIESAIRDSSRAGRIDPREFHIVLSVDQRLNYAHVRPVIYALAQAGITDYSFETRTLANDRGHM